MKTIFALLSIFVSQILASHIDNEILSDPMIQCEENIISLTFKTKKPFTGRVYVQGLADDTKCSRNFARNADQSSVSIKIQNGDCTMTQQRVAGTLEGIMVSMTVVVSFHGTFVTKADRAYRCMCFFKSVKRLSNGIDINAVPTTELMNTAQTPECEYSIRSGSPDGPLVQMGTVGQQIYHIFSCRGHNFLFLVHSCYVDDGRGLRFDLLDVDGCAIDPVIQPDVIYDKDGTRAIVETFGYKFSDSAVLNYQCIIETCKKSTGECRGLTPPKCGRVRRAVSNHVRLDGSEKDELRVLASLTMLNSPDTLSADIPPTLNNSAMVLPITGYTESPSKSECFLSLAIGCSLAVLITTVSVLGVIALSMHRSRSIDL